MFLLRLYSIGVGFEFLGMLKVSLVLVCWLMFIFLDIYGYCWFYDLVLVMLVRFGGRVVLRFFWREGIEF